MSKEEPKPTIKEKMASLEGGMRADRPIEDHETIIGTRRIRGILHVWLLDSRTYTARRLEFAVESVSAAWIDCVQTAHDGILAELRAFQDEL